VGTESARAWFGPWRQLMELDFGPPLHALAVPGRTLHFEEKEALERVAVSRPDRRA
jgi:diphthamide biosynthesis methyltransferase